MGLREKDLLVKCLPCKPEDPSSPSHKRANVTEETIKAVERVLSGEDITKGALYFVSRKYADPEKMRWFDNSLTKLFEHGGHEFFM